MFDKKIKFKAKISYTMGENHPDRKYISDFSTSKIFTFEDVYIFDYGIYSISELKAYIKHDLMLVAGGGYNTKNVCNAAFEIERI